MATLVVAMLLRMPTTSVGMAPNKPNGKGDILLFDCPLTDTLVLSRSRMSPFALSMVD